jgi:hypothetical protein
MRWNKNELSDCKNSIFLASAKDLNFSFQNFVESSEEKRNEKGDFY